MRDTSGRLPARCPECGATGSYRRRFVTGGGWRSVFVCAECGDRVRPDERRVVRFGRDHPRAIAALVAAAVGAVAWFRRRLRREP